MLELFEESPSYASEEQRRCSKCGEIKSIDEFPIKDGTTGRRKTKCRDCCRAYGREHYAKNRETYLEKMRKRRSNELPRIRAYIDEYLRAHPCVDCGESDATVLDFDHRDRSLKRGIVSRIARGAALSSVISEMKKCEVRCGNCHRVRTAEQLNWRKGEAGARLAVLSAAAATGTKPPSSGIPVTEQLSVWDVGQTRRCPDCGEDKRIHEFAFADRRTGKRQWSCRDCHAKRRRAHYLNNRDTYLAWAIRQTERKTAKQRALLDEYVRDHPCVDCGETDIVKLEFDHIDQATKTMNISLMIGRRSWPAILEEIGKCDVRCVNCHRRRTAEQQGWPKRLRERRGRYRRIGTISTNAGVAQLVEHDFPKVEAAGS